MQLGKLNDIETLVGALQGEVSSVKQTVTNIEKNFTAVDRTLKALDADFFVAWMRIWMNK